MSGTRGSHSPLVGADKHAGAGREVALQGLGSLPDPQEACLGIRPRCRPLQAAQLLWPVCEGQHGQLGVGLISRVGLHGWSCSGAAATWQEGIGQQAAFRGAPMVMHGVRASMRTSVTSLQ